MQKATKNKIWRVLGWTLSSISIIIILVAFFLGQYYKPIIANALKKAVFNSTEHLYKIDFDDLNINFITGNFSLVRVRFIPDLAIYQRLKATGKQPAYLYSISMDRLSIKNTHPYELYLNKSLVINEIKLLRPTIRVINDKTKINFDSTGNKFKKPYDLIKGSLKLLNVKQINFKDIDFRYISDSLGKQWEQKLFISDIKIRNLFVDSLSQYNKDKPFYTDDIKIVVKDFSFRTKDSLYQINFEEANASTAASTISLYNFKLNPTLSEAKFKTKEGFQKTRINISAKSLELKDVDFKKIFYEQILHTQILEINKLSSDVYLNKKFIPNPNKERKFPSELPFDIKLPFIFEKVLLNKSKLTYAETEQKSSFRWQISFNEINGNINNLTNDSNRIASNKAVKISLNYLLNNKAVSKIDFGFIYKKKNVPFYCRGYFSNYDLTDLNPILKPLAKVEIANCKLKKLDFNLSGERNKVNGNITMLYNNLRVKVLQTDLNSNKLKESKIYSLLANIMVLKNDNPNVNGKLTMSKVSLIRKKEQSFFNFIWKAILKGAKESVGFTETMEKELLQKASRFKEIVKYREAKKIQRLERKEARKKRKLEAKIKSSEINNTL